MSLGNPTKTTKRIRHAIEYGALRAIVLGVRLTPPLLRTTIAKAVATIARWVTPSRVEIARKNLRLVFTESTVDEINEVINGVYHSIALYALDLIDQKSGYRRIEVPLATQKQMDRVRDIVRSGRPVIFATAHIGHWEAFGLKIYESFPDCLFIAQAQSNPFVDRYLKRLRRMDQLNITSSHEASRALPRALKNGQPVFMVADQDGGTGGVSVDFMGTRASFYRGIGSFAYHYNAPIVVGAVLRDGERLVMQISDIIEPRQDADRDSEVTHLVAAYAERIGRLIMSHPDQWLWTHKRWKSTVIKY